jgi:hypothetical protein
MNLCRWLVFCDAVPVGRLESAASQRARAHAAEPAGQPLGPHVSGAAVGSLTLAFACHFWLSLFELTPG